MRFGSAEWMLATGLPRAVGAMIPEYPGTFRGLTRGGGTAIGGALHRKNTDLCL